MRTTSIDSTPGRRSTSPRVERTVERKHTRKPDEKLQEEYAGVIKQLRKVYLIQLIAKPEGVGVSTVQRMKKKFVDNVA